MFKKSSITDKTSKLSEEIPELADMNFPMEGTFNNAVILSLDKQYPFQARKVAHAIWGLGQLSYTKVIIGRA